MRLFNEVMIVHRHIGGLEIRHHRALSLKAVHRHIGGLEIEMFHNYLVVEVHRHIGGLENIAG